MGDTASRSQQGLELRKFFAPFDGDHSCINEHSVNQALLSDGAIAAYSELVMWRLAGTRCMLSLVDGTTQYFLAGVTREHAFSPDVRIEYNWYGCSSVETPGGLCENVMDLHGDPNDYPCFEVRDLSTDPRFCHQSVVDGRIDDLRFYAGTPIITQHGINIGSFFFFDRKPRPEGLTKEHRKILFETAGLIMKHLESKRSAVERRRVALMSGGVAKFLERASKLTDLDSTFGSEMPGETKSDTEAETEIDAQESTPDATEGTSQYETSITSDQNGDAPKKKGASEIVLDKIKMTLDHAAGILRESLELTAGGVVFLDTAIGFNEPEPENQYFSAKNAVESSSEGTEASSSKDGDTNVGLDGNGPDEHLMAGMDPSLAISPGRMRGYHDEYRPARVLAVSAAKGSYRRSKVLNSKTLHHFINVYPKGNVWYIDENGYFSSLDQIDDMSSATGKSGIYGRRKSFETSAFDVNRQMEEAALLSKVFPNARQIIFLPLWDARSSRWHSGCFVFNTSAYPVFTVESELSYISSLTNSVMVEICRLDSIAAGQVKSDFISSISHEFRSPLHGILASAEFLHDSELDTTQKELISTIQSCGSTLLDTINHVLDYSKINSFENKTSTGALRSELEGISNVALLCEDIVNGIMAAREFGTLSASNSAHRASHDLDPSRGGYNAVEIILDFQNRDWDFKIQPGAIRRIIMNLFGNAQKYTDRGFILVQLKVKDPHQQSSLKLKPNQKMLQLNVIDSGKGMSQHYMERKLFTPFAQEDSFSPGIGLGLSIVQSIVKLNRGNINVRSELGKGTDIEVLLPVDVPTEDGADSTVHHKHSAAQGDIAAAESVEELKSLKLHSDGSKTVAIWRDAATKDNYHKNIAWRSITSYCKNWFGFTILCGQDPETLATADLVIKESVRSDEDEGSMIVPIPNAKRVLFLQERMSGHAVRRLKPEGRASETVSMPTGPFKLARSILALFRENDGSWRSTISSNQAENIEEAGGRRQNSSQISPHTTDVDHETDGDASFMATDDRTEPASDFKGLADGDWVADGPEPLALPRRPRSEMGMLRPIRPEPKSNNSLPPLTTISSFNGPMASESRSLHILAVDDNSLNLLLLTRYLSKRPMDSVVTAKNGVEAVAAVKKAYELGQDFDVIFMDISMPQMDGFEATRHIRQFERDMRTKALSEVLQLPEHVARNLDVEHTKKTVHAALGVTNTDSASDADATATPPPHIVSLPLRDLGGDVVGSVVIEEKATAHDVHKIFTGQEGGDTSAYIVALTGLASRRDRNEAVSSGFDDFMTKPISFGTIGELLGRMSRTKGKVDGKLTAASMGDEVD